MNNVILFRRIRCRQREREINKLIKYSKSGFKQGIENPFSCCSVICGKVVKTKHGSSCYEKKKVFSFSMSETHKSKDNYMQSVNLNLLPFIKFDQWFVRHVESYIKPDVNWTSS